MADRFWVGGSGSWDATSTTNWSATSGGAGGASAPTSADDVYFDANSNVGTGAFTVTVTGTTASPALCRDFTASGLDGALTFTMGATAWLDCFGSMTLPATNFSVSGTAGARIRFTATTTGKTITTNGVTLALGGSNSNIDFNGVGGEWTLGSALTVGGSINIFNGTFITANYNLTANINFFFAISSGSRAVYLGSSAVSVTGTFGNSGTANTTGLTWDAGTSTISFGNSNAGFNGSSLTYYNVSFTSSASGTATITGTNTFNNLTFTSPSVTGIRNISVNANQTINGTLTFGTANTAIRRMFLRSDAVGTPRTITANTVATLADVDFRDIVGAGTGAWSGTRLGNAGGNSGITFDASKTVYRVGTGNWSATQWSLSSGGSVAVNNFPLAQDTAIFDTGTTTGTHTIDAGWNIGTLDMSALNVAVTLATGTSPSGIYGNFILNSNVTNSGANVYTFSGASNQTLTSAGRAFTQALTINKPAGASLILGDNVTSTSTSAFTLTQGTLDLNGYDLTCGVFFGSGALTRSIAFGANKILLTGNSATIWNLQQAENFSYTGTSRIDCIYSGSTGTRTINHNTGGTVTLIEEKALNFNVTNGSDTFATATVGFGTSINNLNFTGFSGTLTNSLRDIFGNLTFSTGMTLSTGTNATTFQKSSGTQTLTTNGKTLDFPVSKLQSGTLVLNDALTMGSTRTFTLTQGTLNLNGFDLTCGLFNSSNSNVRSIAFGSNNINVTGNASTTLWVADTATNFTLTGEPNVNFTYSGGTGTRSIRHATVAGGSESNAINVYVTAGTDIVNLAIDANKSHIKHLDFTGFNGGLAFCFPFLYGDLTFSSGITLNTSSTLNLRFASAINEQKVIFNGKTADWAFVVANTGSGLTKLLDNMTIGSTRTLTHTSGILDLNDNILTTGLYSSTGVLARQLDVGTGTLAIGGNFTASGSNYTTAGTGTISMTSASSKTFAGGGFTYPTLNQGGAGELIITGANTFARVTNTVQPATIIFPSSTTQNITNFNVNGTAGNLITIESSTSGTQATLNSPANITNLVSYVSLKDSNGIGGIWQAPSNYNNTILTNVTGWFTGVLYADSVVEPCVSNELSSYTIAYGVNVSEGMGVNDVNVSQFIYNGNVLENSTVADIDSKNIIVSAYANVTGIAFVNAYPNASWSAKGSIVGLANVVVNGAPIGDGWTEVPVSNNEWLRQG